MFFKVIVLLIIFIFLYFIFFKRKNKKPIYKVSKNYKNQQLKTYADQEKVDLIENEANDLQKAHEIPPGFLEFNIAFSEDLNKEQNIEVIGIAKKFKKPNPVLLKLINDGFEPNELFDLIRSDTKMTAKVLNAVNSPLFALRTPITSIQHAIIFLGVNAIKNIVMQFTLQDVMKFDVPQQERAYQKLWTASYVASAFSFLLAKELGRENAAELSTRCLLCYLGDMAMLSNNALLADDYLLSTSLYQRIKSSQDTYGYNSAIVGKTLAQEWELPYSIITGIGSSLLPLSNVNLGSDISNDTVQDNLLCYIACRFGDFYAFGNAKDLSSMSGLGQHENDPIEFYYLQRKIELSGFQQINRLFNNPIFIRKVSTLIKNIKDE